MNSLSRTVLSLILIFSLGYFADAQKPLSLEHAENLASHPSSVFYGVSESSLSDPHPSKIKFRPLSAFDNLLSLEPHEALWRKVSLKTSEETDFILDFDHYDFVDLYLFQNGERLEHIKTGFLLPSDQRQIRSDNIAHLQLDQNASYDLYIRTRSTFNDPTLNLSVSTFSDWIFSRHLKGITMIAFLVFLIGAIAYTLFKFVQKRVKAYLCFSMLLASTCAFFGYSSGFLREVVFHTNPEHIKFLMVSLLVAPFCYYRMLQQVMRANNDVFEAKDLVRWTAYANFAVLAVCTVILFLPGTFTIAEQIVRYTLIIDAAVGTASIFTLWRNRDEHRKFFLAGSMTMITGLFIGAIFWENSTLVNATLMITTICYFPVTAYALGMVGNFVSNESPNDFVEEFKENQQMIERQKHDLATQIDELSQKLGGAMQEVEHSAKVKEDFLSIMSHEIRTPLNAIVGLTHLISKEDDIDEIKTNIGTLERSVDALLSLIDDVLDFNKIYTGQLQLENIDFDLHETIKKIAKTYKLSAAQKDINFEFNFDPLIPINVGGDAFRLTQVLDNLLSNAIKFTEDGTIRLSASYLNGHQSDKVRVQFEIEDSGIGITPDDLTKIFDRFQQADSDISRKYGESGLGLSIAKALISMMGCDFNVKSQQGQGSVFSFVLEFERSGPEDKTTRRMEQIEEGLPQGLRVLVVDDNEMNRMILNQFLGKWGIEADDAENGKEAFEKIIKHSYDLVLLDLQMPIMDGYELTKLIRSNDMLRDLPIIAISADSISNVYEKVTAAGMNDFIVKPLNPADLKQKIAVYSHNLQMHSIYSR